MQCAQIREWQKAQKPMPYRINTRVKLALEHQHLVGRKEQAKGVALAVPNGDGDQ